jgi:hypothetical protein
MAWVNFFVHDFYDRSVGDANIGQPPDFEHGILIPVNDTEYMYMARLPAGPHPSRVTHWFDASQVYGSDEKRARLLRTDGGKGAKLQIGEEFLPLVPVLDAEGRPMQAQDGHTVQVFLTGDSPRSSLHIGLMMLHHLWAREHNYLVDELHHQYPEMDEEHLYHTARLIVAAEIVKVHTVEWTAQLVGDPVSSDVFHRFWGQFGKEQYREDLWYSVSDEFISSYILHEIVPPTFNFVNERGEVAEGDVPFVKELFLEGGQAHLLKHHLPNVFNSFGVNRMGLIYPFNVPEDFRRFPRLSAKGTGHQNLVQNVAAAKEADAVRAVGQKPLAQYVDLAAIPVARDRDARVPGYNDMRELLGMPRLTDIGQITRDQDVVRALRSLYKDVNDIEYIVGYKAESRPSNWALTPTQVRTFLPVVIYRILADRFYTRDFTEEVYTRYGMHRLQTVQFYDIIKQHYAPSLLPANREALIFHPWK